MDWYGLGKALAVWVVLFVWAVCTAGAVLTCAGSYLIETYGLDVSVTRESE